jgi:hypothetical protein
MRYLKLFTIFFCLNLPLAAFAQEITIDSTGHNTYSISIDASVKRIYGLAVRTPDRIIGRSEAPVTVVATEPNSPLANPDTAINGSFQLMVNNEKQDVNFEQGVATVMLKPRFNGFNEIETTDTHARTQFKVPYTPLWMLAVIMLIPVTALLIGRRFLIARQNRLKKPRP